MRESRSAFVAQLSCDKSSGMASQIGSNSNMRRAGIRTRSGARFSLIFEGTAVDARGYSNAVIWIADAHRGDEESFVVRADEKSTAFVEPESASRACREFVLTT